MKLTIIGRDDCPYCTLAVDMAKKLPIDHEYIKVDREPSNPLRQFLISQSLTSVPQVFVREHGRSAHLGGWTEFNNWAMTKYAKQLDMFDAV